MRRTFGLKDEVVAFRHSYYRLPREVEPYMSVHVYHAGLNQVALEDYEHQMNTTWKRYFGSGYSLERFDTSFYLKPEFRKEKVNLVQEKQVPLNAGEWDLSIESDSKGKATLMHELLHLKGCFTFAEITQILQMEVPFFEMFSFINRSTGKVTGLTAGICLEILKYGYPFVQDCPVCSSKDTFCFTGQEKVIQHTARYASMRCAQCAQAGLLHIGKDYWKLNLWIVMAATAAGYMVVSKSANSKFPPISYRDNHQLLHPILKKQHKAIDVPIKLGNWHEKYRYLKNSEDEDGVGLAELFW